MIALIPLAFAGSLAIQPDHIVLRTGQEHSTDFTITNTGSGQISGDLALTRFGHGPNCSPDDVHIAPDTLRLLPRREQLVQVHYSGTQGCITAVGVTVGTTEIVVPILVTDEVSEPLVVHVESLSHDRLSVHARSSGPAPIPATLTLVQRNPEAVARLQTVPLVLFPHKCTRTELLLVLPTTPYTTIEGKISWRDNDHFFRSSLAEARPPTPIEDRYCRRNSEAQASIQDPL